MRKYPTIISLLALILTSACSSQENTLTSELGWVKFSLDVEESPMAPALGTFSVEMSSQDGFYSHKWDDIAEIPDYENYYVGAYSATALSGNPTDEGYGCQAYQGSVNFEIKEGTHADVNIPCRLVQSLFQISGIEPDATIVLHSKGHAYVEADPANADPMLVLPGDVEAYLKLTNAQNKTLRINTGLLLKTQQNKSYEMSVAVEKSSIAIACGADKATIDISADAFETAQPQIKAFGFDPNETLKLTEGFPAKEPVRMLVESPQPISRLMLTAIDIPHEYRQFPAESDLWNPVQEIYSYGLRIENKTDNGCIVDFTALLENLAVKDNARVTFVLQAEDERGYLSAPLTLDAEIQGVGIKSVESTKAVIGIDEAQLVIELDATEIELKDFKLYKEENSTWVPISIAKSNFDTASNKLTLGFNIGEGIEPVTVRVEYLDLERCEIEIERNVPEFLMTVDAFATHASLRFIASKPEIEHAIAKYAHIKANGEQLDVISRNLDEHTMSVTGLKPNTSYEMSAIVISGEYEAAAKVTTEEALTIPDPDFEDSDVLIDYKSLPSGGAYSATIFPIFNMQNYSDISVRWMRKYWASVNDKTFCRDAKNHNTWYMQPSAAQDFSISAGGSKSVMLTSVGWSIDGEAIQPYLQEEDSFLPYNNNVPSKGHASAGKVFLGSYSFDAKSMTEKYDEGISFNSRPSSLNGFYKYSPDPQAIEEYGLVVVELLNDAGDFPLIVAKATMKFCSVSDLVAFNLPLIYEIPNVKATKLKIMFSSSDKAGSISEEDSGVPISAYVEEAVFRGSTLWVDNLSFSY